MLSLLNSFIYRLSFILSGLSAGFVHADNAIPLPLQQRAVFYPVATQINGFSCGYNALYNAANFENWCGFSNPAHDYAIFKARTLAFLAKIGRDPLDSSDNKLTEALGTSVLQVQPLYHITFSSDTKQKIILSGSVSISYRKGTSQSTIDQMLAEAHVQKAQDQFKACRNYLNSRKGFPAVIHFMCYVMSYTGKHIVLISVYQNSSGRALYVFDNLNETLTVQHDTTRYLTFLCKELEISDRKQFSPLSLPKKWPSSSY